MNDADGGIVDEVCFPRNKDGWILLSQVLGHKVLLTSAYRPKIVRESNKGNQHREFILELDTSVKAKAKLAIDISRFSQQRKQRN